MSVPFHIFNQGSFVPNAALGVSVSVDNVGDKVKATWSAPTTGRYPYGYKVMFSNAVTSGGTYSLFEATTSGTAQTTTFTAATTPAFSNWYSVGIYSSNIENRLSPVTNGAAVLFGLAAKAATLASIQTLTDGSVDVNWTSNVSLAQPTQQLVVRFYNAATSYDDNTNAIALTGTNYNTGVNVTTNGLNQLIFNAAYTIYVLTSNTINNTTYTSSVASSAITFGKPAIAATPGTINTLSDGSIDVNWTSNVTTARPTYNVLVRFYNAAATYDDNTNTIALTGTNYNSGTGGNNTGLVQLVFNTAYTIYILTSNTLNSSYTQSTSSTTTFGSVAIAATLTAPTTGADGSIDVNWTSNVTTARPIQGLRVLFTTAAGYYDYTDLIALSGTNYNAGTSGNASGLVQLTFNTAYTISILTSNAINSSFTQSSTSTATFGALAYAATGASVATQSDGSITVSWTAYSGTVARPNGDTYIGVNSSQSSGLGATAATYNTGTGGNANGITTLTFNIPYTFYIQTSNALNGATPTSASAGSATFGAVPNLPASISTTAGPGSLAVTVGAPSSIPTSRPVSGYIFTLSGTSSATQTQAGLSYTFTSLATGTYNVSVVAYNAIGNSSSVSQSSISVTSPPAAPSSFAINLDVNGTISLSWTASPSAGIVSYHIYGSNYGTGTTPSTHYTSVGTGLSTTLTGAASEDMASGKYRYDTTYIFYVYTFTTIASDNPSNHMGFIYCSPGKYKTLSLAYTTTLYMICAGGNGGLGRPANSGITGYADNYQVGGEGAMTQVTCSLTANNEVKLYTGTKGTDGSNYQIDQGTGAAGGICGDGTFGGNGGIGNKGQYVDWAGGAGGGGAASAFICNTLDYFVVCAGGGGSGGGANGTNMGSLGQGGRAGSGNSGAGFPSHDVPHYRQARGGYAYNNNFFSWGHAGGYGGGESVPADDSYADSRGENDRGTWIGTLGKGGHRGTYYYVNNAVAYAENGTDSAGTTATVPSYQTFSGNSTLIYTEITGLGSGGKGASTYGASGGGGGGGIGGGGGGGAVRQGNTNMSSGGGGGASYVNIPFYGTIYVANWPYTNEITINGRTDGNGFITIKWAAE